MSCNLLHWKALHLKWSEVIQTFYPQGLFSHVRFITWCCTAVIKWWGDHSSWNYLFFLYRIAGNERGPQNTSAFPSPQSNHCQSFSPSSHLELRGRTSWSKAEFDKFDSELHTFPLYLLNRFWIRLVSLMNWFSSLGLHDHLWTTV